MKPIKSLNGTFEGNGYTISNLTLNSAVKVDEYANATGLIAKLNGSVQNFKKMENVQITSNSKMWNLRGCDCRYCNKPRRDSTNRKLQCL